MTRVHPLVALLAAVAGMISAVALSAAQDEAQ